MGEKGCGGEERESEVWEIVNRERRKTRRINERIKREDWQEYFRRLLERIKGKVVRKEEEEKRGEDNERELSKREIKEAIGKLKDGKATEVDEILGEVWRYGGEEIERWVEKFFKKILGGKGWPEDWKEGVIVRSKKKGRGKKGRGIQKEKG